MKDWRKNNFKKESQVFLLPVRQLTMFLILSYLSLGKQKRCDSSLKIRKTLKRIRRPINIPKMNKEMKIPQTKTRMDIKKTMFKSQIQINLSKWKRILFKMAILGPPISEKLSNTEQTSLLKNFAPKFNNYSKLFYSFILFNILI